MRSPEDSLLSPCGYSRYNEVVRGKQGSVADMRSLEQEPCVVIMAGGAGTRFWPLSTELSPKQLLRPDGEESLLQQSYSRADALTSADRILVLTSEHLADRVAAELPEIPRENIIAEPVSYTHLRAHETDSYLVCRLLLEK